MWSNQSRTQKCTIIIRTCQAGLTLATGCLYIAILTMLSSLDTGLTYSFALSLFSMLVLLYQFLAPRWIRNSIIPGIYAETLLDCLSTVLWLAAFSIAVAWTSKGTTKNLANTNDSKYQQCSQFARGAVSSCSLVKAVAVLAAFLWILFGASSYLSGTQAIRYARHGSTPEEEEQATAMEDRGRPMNSTVVRNQDLESQVGLVGPRPGSMQSTDTAEGRHPGRKISYGGNAPELRESLIYPLDLTPSALSPPSNDERLPAAFTYRSW